MAGQNFIANVLCGFGRGKFTEQSTEASQQKVYNEAQKNIAHFDIHKGTRNSHEQFSSLRGSLRLSVNHYSEAEYNLRIEGDA